MSEQDIQHQRQLQQQQQQLQQQFAQQVASYNSSVPISGAQLHQQQLHLIQQFWQNQTASVEHGDVDFKVHQLPLARIKKVMKTDEEIRLKMVSQACAL